MKSSTIFALSAAAAIAPAMAWPGMKQLNEELNERLARRQTTDPGEADDGPDVEDSDQLIGDLATIGPVTPVGESVVNIIITQLEEGFSDVTWNTTVPAKGTAECAADTCCIWQYIVNDAVKDFVGTSGRCTQLARGAVRQGFHDAGAWDQNSTNGGADGSLILANEITRSENDGLQQIINYTTAIYEQYKDFGVGMADLIQLLANLGTVSCPLGPRVRTFIGRKDSSLPAPMNLLPPVTGTADFLIDLFANKTIKTHGLTALVGAHTSSQQQFVDPSRAFAPQDSTPGIWDVNFYNQTLQNASAIPARVFRFESDINLSQNPIVHTEWIKFVTNQSDWNEDFAREYVRLSLLGVDNINNLTECTKVLPPRVSNFTSPDAAILNKWVNGEYPAMGALVANGTLINQAVLNQHNIKPN